MNLINQTDKDAIRRANLTRLNMLANNPSTEYLTTLEQLLSQMLESVRITLAEKLIRQQSLLTNNND